MRVWITKYALSKGLIEADVSEPNGETGFVYELEPDGNPKSYGLYAHGEGKEWHRTRAEAEARAEVMRNARVKSLQEQVTKLTNMTF